MNVPVPLLVVQSSVAAAVEVNGRFVGEIDSDHPAVSLPVSHTGSVYVSLLPLSGSHEIQLFSITRKLVFKNGELVLPGNTEGIKICRWPGGVFVMEMEPGKLEAATPYSFPFTITSLEWLEGVTSTLFYENGLHLLLEDAEDKLLLGRTVATQARNGTLLPRTTPGGEALLFVLINEPEGERLLCVMQAQGTYSIVFEHVAQSFSISDDGRIHCVTRLNTHLKHEQRSVYALSGSEYALASSEPARRTRRPVAREDVVIAFTEAVRNRFENEALSYLTPDLKEALTFSDIKEFIGEFEKWARPLYGTPPEENCVFMGICSQSGDNIYDARMFKFEMSDGPSIHIMNFKEL